MMKGDHGPPKLLHVLTWGAFDHASHAPQVRACKQSSALVSHLVTSGSSEYSIATKHTQ